ncbi:MAG: hypothetical protein RSH25_16785 [Bacteroides sp.]
MWISWIIFAVVASGVLLYCKFGKPIGHVPDFRKHFSVIGLTIYTIIMLVCCSCRSPQYIPVEKIKTEYKYVDRVQYDSIYNHDSTMIYRDGDTVFVNKYKYLYKYLFINKVDSFVKTDSIQIPYPVERQLNRWESMKMELGGWAFGMIIVMIMIFVWWLVHWLRNK